MGHTQEWIAAVLEEIESFKRLGVYEEVPKGQATSLPLPARLILVTKPNIHGGPARKKARIVICGNFQDVHPDEFTASKTPSYPALRMALICGPLSRSADFSGFVQGTKILGSFEGFSLVKQKRQGRTGLEPKTMFCLFGFFLAYGFQDGPGAEPEPETGTVFPATQSQADEGSRISGRIFQYKIKWILIFGGCFVLICQAPRDESDLPIPAFGATANHG